VTVSLSLATSFSVVTTLHQAGEMYRAVKTLSTAGVRSATGPSREGLRFDRGTVMGMRYLRSTRAICKLKIEAIDGTGRLRIGKQQISSLISMGPVS